MDNPARDFELIQGYIDSTLSENELHEVVYRLKEEPALQALHRDYLQIKTGIRYHHLIAKLEQLRSLEAVLPGTEKGHAIPKRTAYLIPLSIAASIIIAVGIWFFSFRDTRPLHERLFAQSFEAFDSPGSGLTRSETSTELTLKGKAYAAYDKGDYVVAIHLFKQELQKNDDAITHLCLGNAYLASGDVTNAEETFFHMTTVHQDLITQAKWYLALTYLKQNKMEKTKATLWEISKSSTYGEKARKLLKALN